jgi:hypothetical protein
MKHLKLYESFNNTIIPDNVSVWFMDFYASQVTSFLKPQDIPPFIFNESKKFIKNYFKTNKIYRGESRYYEITKPIKFSPDNDAGISWTIDKETALAFIESDNKTFYNYLYVANINNFKYVVSMDYIMDNITENQINLLTNPITKTQMKNYVSESEVLVFDTFTSDNIKITKI